MTETEKKAARMVRAGHATEIVIRLEEMEDEGHILSTEFKLGVLLAVRTLVPGVGDRELKHFSESLRDVIY